MSRPPPKRRHHTPGRDELPTGPINVRFICTGCGADVKSFGRDPLDGRQCLNCIFGKPAHYEQFQAPPEGSTIA